MSVRQAFDVMRSGAAPESDKEAHQWLVSHDRRFGHMIDGEWRYNRQRLDSINPATFPGFLFPAESA